MTMQEKKALKISSVVVPVLAVILYFTGQGLSDKVKAYNADKYMADTPKVEQAAPQAAGFEDENSTVPSTDQTDTALANASAANAGTGSQNEVTIKTDSNGNQTVTPNWNKQPTASKSTTAGTGASTPAMVKKSTASTSPANSGKSTVTPKKSSDSSTTPKSETKTTPKKPSSDSKSPSGSNDSKTPKGGETNSNGQVYVPGFGWTTPSKVEVESANKAGTGEIIGH